MNIHDLCMFTGPCIGPRPIRNCCVVLSDEMSAALYPPFEVLQAFRRDSYIGGLFPPNTRVDAHELWRHLRKHACVRVLECD